MTDLLLTYGLFLAKTITIVVAIIIVLSMIASIIFKGKAEKKDQIQIKNLNEKYRRYAKALEHETLPKQAYKQKAKQKKKKRKAEKKHPEVKKRLFVLDFVGDIRASAVEALGEEITALLTVATPRDEVLLRLESTGGMVHSYGFAASQLNRIKQKGIPLTIAVDKVAASGGYMMACVADRLLAAPFAIVGSIGVIAQLPNLHRFLKEHHIDYEQITAGKYKRTLTLLGENTDEDREKTRQDLEDTHQLFKEFILHNRGDLDIENVATGDIWYGSKAIGLKLVDEIMTSDDYLMAQKEEADLFEVNFAVKKNLLQRLPMAAQNQLHSWLRM